MKLKLYNKLNEDISSEDGGLNNLGGINGKEDKSKVDQETDYKEKQVQTTDLNDDEEETSDNKKEIPDDKEETQFLDELIEKLKIYYDLYNNKEETLKGFEFLQNHSLDNFNQLISEFNSNKKELLKNTILKKGIKEEEGIYSILHFVIEISQKLLNAGIFNNIKYQDIINNITELQNSINQEIKKYRDDAKEEIKKDREAQRKKAENEGSNSTQKAKDANDAVEKLKYVNYDNYNKTW